MQRFFLFFFFLFFFFLFIFIQFDRITFAASDNYKSTVNHDKKLIENIAFSEIQIFKKIYAKDDVNDRLERLEQEVYGAIQAGDIGKRAKELRKSVTNISSGGYGLQYSNKIFDVAGNGFSSIGTTFSNQNPYHHYHRPYSNKMYHPRHHSHRLPPPRHPKSNPLINGNSLSDYSLGTGIKILRD